MAKVRTLDEVEQEERERAVKSHLPTQFVQELAAMPERRQKLVLGMLMSPTRPFSELAREAGYKIGKNSKASQIYKQIQGAFGTALMELGITQFDLLQVAVQNLKATKKRYIKVPRVNEEGKTIAYDIQVMEEPDYGIRQRMFDKLVHLGNYLPADKKQIEHTHILEAKTKSAIEEARRRNNEVEQGAIPVEYVEVEDGSVN